jgi:hypothetical protein
VNLSQSLETSFRPGDKYTLTYSYKLLGGDIKNGSTSSYVGFLNGLVIIDNIVSLCDQLVGQSSCPQYDGESIFIKSSTTIPENIPSGKLYIRNEWITSENHQVLCFTYELNIDTSIININRYENIQTVYKKI